MLKFKYSAVMASRNENKDSLDYFPTPPWATRALLKYIINENISNDDTCLEPACGEGHMSKALSEYFINVDSYDIHNYGYGNVRDFLNHEWKEKSYDWVITNPPFNKAEQFIEKSITIARKGSAFLTRSVFLESNGRYNRLFKDKPLTKFAQFVERVPMVKGRLNKDAASATSYAWLVWLTNDLQKPEIVWVPPCRKALEKPEDYHIGATLF